MIKAEKPVHPFISLIVSVLLSSLGLTLVKERFFPIFLSSVGIVYLLFGYGKVMVRSIAFLFPLILINGLIAYFSSGVQTSVQTAYRFLILGLAAVPTISIEPISLVRASRQIGVPSWVGMGLLIVFRFFPIILEEMKKIHQAIKIRGIRFFKEPSLFTRSFFIPLLLRINSISENLAKSMETRAYSREGQASLYKTVDFGFRDFAFGFLLVFIIIYFVLQGARK